MCETSHEERGTLADRFLRDLRETGRRVSVYLVNGFQLKGEIVELDEEAILFKLKDAHQLVMRSAVAGMYPLPSSQGQTEEWWREYVSDQE